MSLILSNTDPVGVEVKTFGDLPGLEGVLIRIPGGTTEVQMSERDFFLVALYVLKNTNLHGSEVDDPRMIFLERARLLTITTGFGGRGKRLIEP